jgi:hypothetical protein
MNQWESIYLWDKLQCTIFPMWMERVLFYRKERRGGWRPAYGEQIVREEVRNASPKKTILDRNYRMLRELSAHNLFPMEEHIIEESSSLQYAIKEMDYELIRLLLSLGAHVLEGYEEGQTPIELAGLLGDEKAIHLLLEALTTDVALEQGMIPPEFGLGEWDNMWEGPCFFNYYGYFQELHDQKLYIRNNDKSDAIKLYLYLGMEETPEVMKNYLDALRRKLEPFGYLIWKAFRDYDRELQGIEITRYTFFRTKDKWLAYEHMFFYDESMELHLNTLKEWDEKYGVIFEELDYESLVITFKRMPENREVFWEEAFAIFPKVDDLDLKDAERRSRLFSEQGRLEFLLI